MAKKANGPSTTRPKSDSGTASSKSKRTSKVGNEETKPLVNSDNDILNDVVDNGGSVSKHPNGAGLSLEGTSREERTDIEDMNTRSRDAGTDPNYTSGIGSGASPVGSGGEGFSDDEIRSSDDPRIGTRETERSISQSEMAGGNMNNPNRSSEVSSSQGRGDSRRSSTKTVAAVFGDWNAASRAIDALYSNNFTDSQIGIARMDREGGTVFKGSSNANEHDQAKNVAGGVATGAAVGGIAGLLAALASLAIPGVGPIVAGGVLATTFGTAAGTAVAGAGIGAGVGAAAGGLVGALTDIGLPEEDARMYEERLRSGDTLVTVSAGGRAAEAQAILENNGGRSYSNSANATSSSAFTRGETF